MVARSVDRQMNMRLCETVDGKGGSEAEMERRLMSEWVDGWLLDSWINGWADGWLDVGWLGEWMDG